jgi:hypothetical protein
MIPVHHRRKRMTPRLPWGAHNFLSVLEGIEGGFAISTGIIAGLSFGVLNRNLLLTTAFISILVNGFNAAAVKFSSEHYDDELDHHEHKNIWKTYFTPAAVEFLAYLMICVLIVLPLAFLPSIHLAVAIYVALTLYILFIAGYYRGTLLRTRPVRDGLEVASLGLFIVAVGATAGFLLSRLVVS